MVFIYCNKNLRTWSKRLNREEKANRRRKNLPLLKEKSKNPRMQTLDTLRNKTGIAQDSQNNRSEN